MRLPLGIGRIGVHPSEFVERKEPLPMRTVPLSISPRGSPFVPDFRESSSRGGPSSRPRSGNAPSRYACPNRRSVPVSNPSSCVAPDDLVIRERFLIAEIRGERAAAIGMGGDHIVRIIELVDRIREGGAVDRVCSL